MLKNTGWAWLAVAFVVVGALPACSPPSQPSSGNVTVRFVYRAPTATRPDVPTSGPILACVRFSAPTHAHIGWRAFELVNMTAVGSDRWELTQTDVPVGPRNTILISDPNTCFQNPEGFATTNLSANDVPLTRLVRDGGGDGLAFTVAANGTVTP
jgi:hypothetical protein